MDDEDVSEFLDGRLSPTRRRALMRHLSQDPPSAQRLKDLGRADAAARKWFDTMLGDPTPEAVETIRRGFNERRTRGWRDQRWMARTALAAGIASVMLVGHYEIDRRVDLALEEVHAQRQSDLQLLKTAMQQTLEKQVSGSVASFRNDKTGRSVTLIPRRTWLSESGHWCRAFQEIIDGTNSRSAPVGVACREGDGQWRRIRTEYPGAITSGWTTEMSN